MSTTDPTSGISAALLQRIRAALLRSPTLQSQAELAALFTDARTRSSVRTQRDI